MPYTADKKPEGLTAATVLNAGDNIVIDQSGDVKKATLTQVEAKVFAAKSALTTPSGTEVTIVRQTDGVLRQVPLANIVPALNITNAKISAGANIVDTKLATINTSGKVTNAAVQAVPAMTLGGYSNAIGANKIVARDGSGNFAAGTITASLSGNASTATTATTASTLNPGRTIAINGDVTGTATLFNGSVAITIPTTITNNSIVDADINSAAAIVDTKLATITTAGKVADTATSGTGINTPLTLVRRNASGNFSAGTITADLVGDVTGNATTATTLATGKTIALTGDVTGTTATFNGSVNVSAATTIVAGSVNTAKLATATQQSLVPAGAVMPFARATAPAGWLIARVTPCPTASAHCRA
jgi:trimeric autotransporter adhesin